MVGIALIFLAFGLLWAVDFPNSAPISPDSYNYPAMLFVEFVFVTLFWSRPVCHFPWTSIGVGEGCAHPFTPQNLPGNAAAKCNPLARAKFLSIDCHDDAKRVFRVVDLRVDEPADHLSDVRAVASTRASHILEEATARRDGCKSAGSDDGRLHQTSEPGLS